MCLPMFTCIFIHVSILLSHMLYTCWHDVRHYDEHQGHRQQSGCSPSRVKQTNNNLINSNQDNDRGQSQCFPAQFIHIILNTNVIRHCCHQAIYIKIFHYEGKLIHFMCRQNSIVKWNNRNAYSGGNRTPWCALKGISALYWSPCTKHMVSEVHSVKVLHIYFK